MGYIRQASSADSAAITALRLTAYRRAPEFDVVDTSALVWGHSDEAGIVLGAWNSSGDVVSTTRGEVYQDRAAAEAGMECRWAASDTLFPALLLGKGATSGDAARQGLHSALRYHFLMAAKDTAIGSLLGIVYEHADRTRLMQRVGYDLLEPSRFWYTDLNPRRATLIAVLVKDRFEQAIETLRAELHHTLEEYPFTGDALGPLLAIRCATVPR